MAVWFLLGITGYLRFPLNWPWPPTSPLLLWCSLHVLTSPGSLSGLVGITPGSGHILLGRWVIAKDLLRLLWQITGSLWQLRLWTPSLSITMMDRRRDESDSRGWVGHSGFAAQTPTRLSLPAVISLRLANSPSYTQSLRLSGSVILWWDQQESAQTISVSSMCAMEPWAVSR